MGVTLGKAALGVVALAALVFGLPFAAQSWATAKARACVSAVELPRGPELPDCQPAIEQLDDLSRIRWVKATARYRAEELGARVVLSTYRDAAVGRPDPAQLALAAPMVFAAEKVILAGSERVVLEELGRAAGAPHLGRQAMLLGDRQTLLYWKDLWDDWVVRQRTLEAALLEADLDRAGAIAKSYADWDPYDQDLRLEVATVLCLGADPKRGHAFLKSIQDTRASSRHESWSRNWGDVRVLLVACAARAKEPPAPTPENNQGGIGDRVGAQTSLDLRLIRQADEVDTPRLRNAATTVIRILKGPLPAGFRVRVLAALLGSGHPVDASLAADLATPRAGDDEPPLFDPAVLPSPIDWLDGAEGGREVRAWVPAGWFKQGAARLRELSGRKDEVTPPERDALLTGAGALSIAAARAFAAAGDVQGALAAIDEATAPALIATPERHALARATVLHLMGEREKALVELDGIPAAADVLVRAAARVHRAELLASLGRKSEAAAEAVAADEEAAKVMSIGGSHRLEVRARWNRLALAHSVRGSGILPDPGDRRWPWVGAAAAQGVAGSWLSLEGEGTSTERGLDFFAKALDASPEDRRAIRYAVFNRHRGDVPVSRAAYFAVMAGLLREGEGDVETWLDAATATDAAGTSLRAHAWLRAEAARWRGDAKGAARWDERHTKLAKVASDPELADLAQGLGI